MYQSGHVIRVGWWRLSLLTHVSSMAIVGIQKRELDLVRATPCRSQQVYLAALRDGGLCSPQPEMQQSWLVIDNNFNSDVVRIIAPTFHI